MKKLKKVVVCLSILCSILFTGNMRASAYDVYGYRFDVDLNDSACFYNEATASKWGNTILSGFRGWNYKLELDFLLYWHRTLSSLADADTYVTTFSDPYDSALAYTEWYWREPSGMMHQVSASSQNWNFCIIRINDARSPDYTTLMHEFGHVMGLTHRNTDPTSIMCQAGYGRTATNPSSIDLKNLDYLY